MNRRPAAVLLVLQCLEQLLVLQRLELLVVLQRLELQM